MGERGTDASRAEAKRRVEEALRQVSEARTRLDLACQALSGCTHALREWGAVAKECDRVHAVWYRVEKLRDRNGLDLDGIVEIRPRGYGEP